MSSSSDSASPAAAIMVIFGCLAFMIGIMLTGFVGDGAAFLYALAAIGSGGAYLTGAIFTLRSGDTIGGNTFLYFSCFFSLMSGLTGLGVYFASVFGWPVDTRIIGWMWLFVGAVLSGTTASFRKWGLPIFTLIVLADIGLLLLGLVYVGAIGPVFLKVVGYLFLAVGLLGGYSGVSVMNMAAKSKAG